MPSPLSRLLETFTRLKVLVIGDAILDCYLAGTAERICPEAPVPVVAVRERSDSPGGAANTAVNISSLGAFPIFLSVVGNDAEGQRLCHKLEAQGVGTDRVLVYPQRQTLAKHRVLADTQMVVRFDQGHTKSLDWEMERHLIQHLEQLFEHCDAIVIADYGYGLLTPSLIQALSKLQAHSPRLIVADSKHLGRYRQVGVTAVKPNYGEAVRLLSLDQAPHFAEEIGLSHRADRIALQGEALLRITGAQLATVTLDAEGVLLLQRDKLPQHIAAKPTVCACATGAGDTFVSAMALALAVGASVEAATELACAAAAIAVSKPGTTPCFAQELKAFATQGNISITDPEGYPKRTAKALTQETKL